MPFAVLPDPQRPSRRVRVAWAQTESEQGHRLWFQAGGVIWHQTRQGESEEGLEAWISTQETGLLAPRDLPPSATDALSAPMAARVVEVLVQATDKVDRGQTLVVLEAMKCEQRLVAPVDAVITRVDCQPGQQVQDGQMLLRWREVTAEGNTP